MVPSKLVRGVALTIASLLVLSSTVVAGQATPGAGTPVATGIAGPYFTAPADLLSTLPAGEGDAVSVIGNGLVFQNQVFVAVRNNTAAAVGSVSVAVSAIDAGGALIAVGSSEQVVPAIIQPGGVAQTLIALQSPAPDGTQVAITVSAGAVPSYVSTPPLTITQATDNGSAIIGFAMNPSGTPASFPRFAISCWAADGTLASYPAYTVFDGYTVPAGGSAAFTATATGCDRFLVTAG